MPLDAQAFPAAGPVEALPPPGTSRIRQNSMFCRLGFDSHRKGLHGRWEGANKLSEPPLPSLYGMWEAQWFHMACLALPSWWTHVSLWRCSSPHNHTVTSYFLPFFYTLLFLYPFFVPDLQQSTSTWALSWALCFKKPDGITWVCTYACLFICDCVYVHMCAVGVSGQKKRGYNHHKVRQG